MENEALKHQIITRSAKAALLLWHLKLVHNHGQTAAEDDGDQERKILVAAVRDLKMKLVMEEAKNRRLKLWKLVETALLMAVLLSLWTTCLMLVLDSL